MQQQTMRHIYNQYEIIFMCIKKTQQIRRYWDSAGHIILDNLMKYL